MPRSPIPLLAALAAAALCGCGGHGAFVRRGSPRAGRPAASALSRSRALAFAHAVNLTAADVPPEFSRSAHHGGTPPQKHAEGELFACVGARQTGVGGRGGDLANASSPSFQFRRGVIDLGVSSEVGVSRSAALARADLAAMRSGRVRACFQRYLDSVLAAGSPRGTSIGPVTIESGNPPAPGTSGSFGWRVRATFGLGRVKVPVYMDLLGFVYGPARVTLVSSGALEPFPALAQQRLFALLLQRARRHGI